jgi:alcohol dehydrogenase (cytochrome c)
LIPGSRSLFRLIGLAFVFALLGGVLALAFVPKARVALKIARLKASGMLPDVSWKELARMSRPGSHFNLPELATTPNPYAVIQNPYNFAADVSAGNALFRSHCATCHGADGSGGAGGPALQHRQMTQGSSDWALYRTISYGIPDTAMRASDLPWHDKWQLVAYVNSLMLRGEQAVEATPDSKIRELKPVRYEDIIRGAAQIQDEWLTYSGSYDGHRFSSIGQITPSNAAGLRLLWMRQYNIAEPSIETSPLVVQGFMFVTVQPNRVEALDAKTGELIWAYDRKLPNHVVLSNGYQNRGLAVLGDTLFFGTLDAHLVALDIKTGEVRWDVKIADHDAGYSITSAPLALKNLVITGIAGGEFGIRGFLEARDADTGKEVWKFKTIPEPGQPGSETWEGDAWKTGGSPTWLTGSFDPETNLIYWPVGNPSPNFNGRVRKGDNLYSNSVLAIDADSGTLRWHFQFMPHDVFDWDATEILVLFDKTDAGARRRYLAQANRNGFYYLLDRNTGHYELAHSFAQQTWAEGIDNNGRPVMNPEARPTEKGTVVYPGVGGATNWESPSYSPQTGYFYVNALDWGGVFYEGPAEYRVGKEFAGGSFQFFTGVKPQGAVRALNAMTGEQIWEYRNPAYHVGGLLSTAGGVVFGSQMDIFFALDAKTGRELWRVNTSGRIVAAPITFLHNGKQIVTIAAGHDILTFGL